MQPDDIARIYHGTPMTPRAALRAVGAGRGLCVSFFRPDDIRRAVAKHGSEKLLMARIADIEAELAKAKETINWMRR